MRDKSTLKALAEMLTSTANAHHSAFAATNGFDPDWTIWYADHLIDELNPALGAEMSKAQLVYLMVGLDLEHRASAPGSEWSKFYARSLQTRYLSG